MRLFAALYLDEDVSVLLFKLMKARGFDVLTARDAGMLGKDDQEQLAYSARNGRVILTHNRVHFEQLHTEWLATQNEHAGIVVANRRDVYDLASRVARLLNSVSASEIANQLFYV